MGMDRTKRLTIVIVVGVLFIVLAMLMMFVPSMFQNVLTIADRNIFGIIGLILVAGFAILVISELIIERKENQRDGKE